MPDIDEQIEHKAEEYREVADKITSDDFEELEEDERQNLYDKRDKLAERIEELKKQKEQRSQLREGGNEPTKPSDEEIEKQAEMEEKRSTERYFEAYNDYLRNGERRMDDDNLSVLRETRDMATNDDNKGGFFVPQEMEDQIVEARKQFNGIRRANVTVIQTERGGTLDIPTNDDTGNKGEIIGEGTTVSNQDLTAGVVSLESFTFSSKDVNVSRQLLQDSAFDLESLLARKLGERIGRKAADVFTTGSGSSEPHGIVTASSEGHEASSGTGSDSDVVEEDLIDLKHSVDPAYRENAEFMMHDSIWQNLKKTQDSNGQPIFLDNYRDGEPQPMIDGDPVIINNSMQNTISADNKTVLYGDFSRYWIREVQGIEVMRLEEINARSNQVTFLAFARMDGNLLDAGGGPVKHLKQ